MTVTTDADQQQEYVFDSAWDKETERLITHNWLSQVQISATGRNPLGS
ncbi:hypothetical protein J7F03_04785 [Streptomyces sp. ISL-43]|nr:hypothetical protein [Streptomyces sp. ISL-43]MBT2446410.1 hypothetical protein [Streptomyces sp. ISL-43]